MLLIGLPASFSEQAKFDRAKGFHPIRITFQSNSDDKTKELVEYWPEGRIPVGFSDDDDLDAEGKYNHELFEATNPIEIESSSSEESDSVESEIEEVPDYEDGPLLEF